MATFILNLCGLVIAGAVILFHSWGFWRVYNWSLDQDGGFSAAGRGAMAGLTGWFWLCMVVGVTGDSGWMMLIWFFGLLFAPAIGMLLTLLVRGFDKKFRLELRFWKRSGFGTLIGIAAGAIFALIVFYPHPNREYSIWRPLITMAVAFGSIGFTSGIMAGERNIEWWQTNSVK